MQLVTTLQQVVEYKKQLERQKEILLVSPAFTLMEQEEMASIYNWLIAICDEKIATLNKPTK